MTNYQVIPCSAEARQDPHTAQFSQLSEIQIFPRAKSSTKGRKMSRAAKEKDDWTPLRAIKIVVHA